MSSFSDAVGLGPDDVLDDQFQSAFHALFADLEKNRDEIVLMLGKIVAYVARGISMANREDSSDLESEVYQHTLKILRRYREAYRNGVPAYDWFRKAINRKFWELTKHDLMVRQRSVSIDAFDEGAATPATDHDQMAVVRSAKKKRLFRLKDPADIATFTRYVDFKIGKMIRAYSITNDEVEKHDCRLLILGYQDIRHELVGAFKRILTEGVEYTRARRNHHLPPPRLKAPTRASRIEDQIIMRSQLPLWTLPN